MHLHADRRADKKSLLSVYFVCFIDEKSLIFYCIIQECDCADPRADQASGRCGHRPPVEECKPATTTAITESKDSFIRLLTVLIITPVSSSGDLTG